MTVLLRQWRIKDDTEAHTEYFFTPELCGEDTALAIAVATYGDGVSDLVDEGIFNQVVPQRFGER